MQNFQQNARRIGREARETMFESGAATLAGGAAMAHPLKKAADLELLRKSMEIYTRSAEKGAVVYKNIVDLANQTPLGLEEVAKSVTVAMGSGLTAAKAIQATRMLGDITAANPMADMGAAMVAYTQAAQGGKLMTRDIWQLINSGVPIVDILRNHLGATAKIMGKGGMAEEGKITFEVLQQAMEKATGAGGMFENGLTKMADTGHGKFRILRDAADQLSAAFGESVLPTFIKLGNAMIPLINGITSFIRKNTILGQVVMFSITAFTLIAAAVFAYSSVVWVASFAVVQLSRAVFVSAFRAMSTSYAYYALQAALWSVQLATMAAGRGVLWMGRGLIFTAIPAIWSAIVASNALRFAFTALSATIYGIPIIGWAIALGAALGALAALIYNNWDAIVGFFSMLGDKFANFIPKAKKWGSEMIRSIVDGIKEGAPSLFAAIDGVVAFARGFFPASPAKHGAFKDLHKVKIIEQVAQSVKPNSLVKSISAATSVGAASVNRSLSPVASGGGGSVSVNYSPVITIGAGATVGDKASFMEVLENHKSEMMRMIAEAGRTQNRKAYA
jgi:tape measure domain-containing protein